MADSLNDRFTDLDEYALRASAETHRDELPSDLFNYFNDVEASLARGVPPQEFRERGLFDVTGKLGKKLGTSVLGQLHNLLCTSDPTYNNLRVHGRIMTNAAIVGVAAKAAPVVGVSVSVASAATAYGILLISRAGIEIFCKTFSQGSSEKSSADVCTILFLAANPSSTTRLGLDREVSAIEKMIRAAEYRDSLKLISKWAVCPDDLLQALNEYPDARIMHFSGHGSSSEEIILTNDKGEEKPVGKSAMKALLETLGGGIRLVFLNACFSMAQAEAIVEHVDCAIGMNTAIGDEAAILFAASVYRAIGFDKSVKKAFDQGIAAILLEGVPEDKTPVLLCKEGVDPSDVYVRPRKTD